MEQIRDGRADFDFLIGTWQVQHSRLKERLQHCTDWEEFTSVATAQQILGGMGNFDEITMQRAGGVVYGASLRLYNPVSGEWAIYWANSVRATLDTPMIGKFDGQGHGVFYALDTHADQHIFCRFIWTVSDANTCRWEQAFSADGGVTWETNWTMDFVRQS